MLPAQIIWETGGQDWVDELKDNEYKMAEAPHGWSSSDSTLHRSKRLEAMMEAIGIDSVRALCRSKAAFSFSH